MKIRSSDWLNLRDYHQRFIGLFPVKIKTVNIFVVHYFAKNSRGFKIIIMVFREREIVKRHHADAV